MTGLEWVRSLLRRLTGAALSLVQVPRADPPPPDIDGRRSTEPDAETLARIEWERKAGRGGYR
jgi:hypothetical protein